MMTAKDIEKIINENKVKGEVHHYTEYFITRFKEIKEEAEKMHWKDRNSYLAGCYEILAAAAIKKLTTVDKHFKKYEGQ